MAIARGSERKRDSKKKREQTQPEKNDISKYTSNDKYIHPVCNVSFYFPSIAVIFLTHFRTGTQPITIVKRLLSDKYIRRSSHRQGYVCGSWCQWSCLFSRSELSFLRAPLHERISLVPIVFPRRTRRKTRLTITLRPSRRRWHWYEFLEPDTH